MALYLLDSHFLTDTPKFISGALSCLSAMVRLGNHPLLILSSPVAPVTSPPPLILFLLLVTNLYSNTNFPLEVPHINVLTKIDVLETKQKKGKFIDRYI